MNEIGLREKEVTDEFGIFGEDWEARYEHLVELGRTLSPMAPEDKTDEALIRGCQSRVWLKSELKDGKMVYTGDSDAIITKGMVALMIRVLGNQMPADIVKAEMAFVDRIGLKEHLSPTRANGLVSMINRMKLEAAKHVEQG